MEITFECNQDWDQMKISGHGRHCEVCRKTVHDFTNKSDGEIARTNGAELCGVFQREQVESHLTPIEVPFLLRTMVLTTATFLGLELGQGYAQDGREPHKIENTSDYSKKADTLATTGAKEKQLRTSKQDECGNVVTPPRSRYYFSKRFPFIVKRRPRVMGRFRQ